MKKATLYGPRDVRVEEVEEPRPGPGQAKVKVKYCGICGSDLHEYLHGPFPASPFGHEVCGLIAELGPEMDGYVVGERVLAFMKDGYATYQVLPKARLMKLPDVVSWERAAVIEPLAGAAYAVERGRVQPADAILIAGGGPVGLMVLIAVRAFGARSVYVSELVEKRRRLAESFGATAVFDPREVKIPEKMRELTGGRGVDVAIEAVGVEAALKDCLASTRRRGTVLVQGIFTERVPIHMLGFVTREITMIGSNSTHPARAMEWVLAGKAEPEKIVTHIIPLERIVEDGFGVLTNNKAEAVKILVEP